jgi:hypothetical protein
LTNKHIEHQFFIQGARCKHIYIDMLAPCTLLEMTFIEFRIIDKHI